jgi:hypothetical protein
MKQAAILLAATLVSVTSVAAEPRSEWVKISTNPNGVELLVRADDVVKSTPGEDVRVWTKSIYPASDSKREQVGLASFNCRTKMWRTLQVTTYRRNGEVDTDATPTPWHYVVPDTVVEAVAKVVCQA